MIDRLRFYLNRLRERLWVKPLGSCLLSIAAAFLASMADNLHIPSGVPEISAESIETLLGIMSASMLVISVFAVNSMLSAYASASSTATPRSFAVIVADDVSQNALSTFIGAFIFSIVALVALMNGYYGQAGLFVLFILTIFVFSVVILRFVRWVDGIARLGRLSTTVDKIENVTRQALLRRRRQPSLGGVRATADPEGQPVSAETVGYVQRIDMDTLQSVAARLSGQVQVSALPGTFISPGQTLACVAAEGSEGLEDTDKAAVRRAFRIDGDRTFDGDPRFGLVVLAEIACRALSPAVNDPGTAIDIIRTHLRLFAAWDGEAPENPDKLNYDRVLVPELSVTHMLDDAFSAMSRDGAGNVQVMECLMKTLQALRGLSDEQLRDAAERQAQLAMRHAELKQMLPEELAHLRQFISA